MTACQDPGECDVINTLPDELMIYIFHFLPLDTLMVCEDVCKRWKKLAVDPALWRHILIVYSGKPGETELSNRNLQIIATHHQYIRCLKIIYEYNYMIIKSIIVKCSNLLSLEIVMCRIGKDFEEYIKSSPNLRWLSFKNSLLLGKENFYIKFDAFKDLRYLALSDFGLNTDNCNSLLGCNKLTHIFIEKIKDLRVHFIKELIMSKQNTLDALHIYGGDAIDDECLELLGNCTSFKDLAIIRCESLTDKGLIQLSKIKNIHHLHLWNNNKFSEAALLKTLSSPNLVKLRSLSLSRITNVTPVIMDVISEYFKQLKFLAVYRCPQVIVNTDYSKQLKSKLRNVDIVLH